MAGHFPFSVFVLLAVLSLGSAVWLRDVKRKFTYFDIGFSLTNTNVGKCSLLCEETTNCVSFAFDTLTSTCTGFLMKAGQMTAFTQGHWYFAKNVSSENVGYVYNFTTCGKTGPLGPDLQACLNAYTSSANLISAFQVAVGIQQWTVPVDGFYRMEAAGAAGGTGYVNMYAGGKGAVIQGSFDLTAGTVLNIVCGQMGSDGGFSEPAGGGGGTFVYTGSIGGNGLLIAAGGGGGGGEEYTGVGMDGQSTEQAKTMTGLVGLSTSSNGGIGFGGASGFYSSAGAGWYSDGGGMLSGYDANPGARWAGGSPVYTAGAGGFGGGGSGVYSNGGGGAGGYTGGWGTDSGIRTDWGGSGAGSYNSGVDKNNVTGYNSGYGYVAILHIQ